MTFVFLPLSIEVLLDSIQLVFHRHTEIHLKIEPTNSIFYTSVLSAGGISANPKKVEKVWDWSTPTSVKELHSIFRICLLLSEVHSQICLDGPMFT